MKTNTIRATYGSDKTPCNLFTLTTHNGDTWYCVEGSCNVNLAPGEIEPGADIEEIQDIDTFTWPNGVHSEEELETAIDA